MNVDRNNFFEEMPNMIEAISKSDILCIDLEMSGIYFHTVQDHVNRNIHDVYKKAKEAADNFNILQLGLTCVSWDQQASAYVTKTYNIGLAPCLVGDDQISNELASKVQRQAGFSSQSMAFLLANNFNIARVFEHGVPYLSHTEVGQARLAAWVTDRNFAEDHINIRDLPNETQNFCRLMQSEIQNWVTARVFGDERSKTLTLASPYGGRFSPLQKRLVHQIVDAHFYNNCVHSKQGSFCMEVSPANHTADKKNGRILALRFQALMKLTGARFIWDAITGEPFASNINPEVIVGQDPDAIITIRQRLFACEARLRKKQPIIVGHNMLHDLCFLLKTFTGKLPDTVREFQQLVRKKLSNIVDTKYLFTHGDHEMMPDKSLEECFNAVRLENAVSIIVESDAFGYKKAMPHQAGYDSFMTATVFLKKAYQLSKKTHDLRAMPLEIGVAPRNGTHHQQAAAGLLMDDDDEMLANLAMKFEPLKPATAGNSTPVVDPSKEEKKKEEGDGSKDGGGGGGRIPDWKDGAFWTRYGNRVRVGVPAMMLYTGN